MATGDQTDLFSRLKAMLPTRWFGTRADTPDDVDGVATGAANALAFLYSLYAYAKQQTRIATATDGWLDLIAADFFGTTLLRKTGQSDESYRAAINARLLREKGTRNAITIALTALTGQAPTIIEPTKPADTGAYAPNPRATLAGASIYRTDWQGRVQLSSTARTNLCLQSETMSVSPWSTGGIATRTANAATSPIGTLAMTKLAEATGTAEWYIEQSFPTAAGTWTWSVVVKAAERSAGYIAAVTVGEFGTVNYIAFNLSTGTIAAPANNITATYIENLGNGFFRLAITFTSTSLTTSLRGRINLSASYRSPQVYTGTSGSGFYVWGGDFKESLSLTPYIGPTTTAPVTVTDYTNNGDGTITVAEPVDGVTATLSTNSPADGLPDGSPLSPVYSSHTLFTTTLPMTGPFAPVGYGAAGAYGSLSLPYQAFVIAYRPHSAQGIGSVAGYGISTGGYSQASQAEYATISDATGGVLDSDIFAAVAAVKPAGTIVWTAIRN